MPMTFDTSPICSPILPEIAILVTASVVLILDLYLKDQDKGLNHSLTLLGLVIAIALTGLVGGGEAQVFFDGNLIRDAMTDLLRGAILIVSILTFVYARPWLQDRGMLVGEFYVLGLLAVLGMLIMVSANGFLTLYLGLELQALALYALVAFDRDSSKGAEAAMKYFVLGALGSGLLLYGVSMIYGATGSIEFGPVAAAVAEQGMSNKVLVFGIAFLVIGIGFKFGAVPFHMWVPDVYEGGPTPAVLILSSAPKIAAFALAVRMLVDGLHTCTRTGRECWSSWPCCPWVWAIWSPSPSPTSSGCWPIRPSRMSASSSWDCWPAPRRAMPPPCSTPSSMR
jgi:NADH-quinone oxidoreductase subunit N